MGWVQWRGTVGTVGTVEGYGGYSGGVRWKGTVEGVQWVQWRDKLGTVEEYNGLQRESAHTHTMLKTLKMCNRRVHVCDFIVGITFCSNG